MRTKVSAAWLLALVLGCSRVDDGAVPAADPTGDSDGDGLSDATEDACVSDRHDASQKCYGCGWKHNDPGNLVSTGNNEGDVIGNMQLVDQCLEPVSLWDFATTPDSPDPEPAEYHILLMSGAW